jgi:hypothetical protein
LYCAEYWSFAASWFGKWEGDARPDNTIRILMVFEKADTRTYGESHLELRLREDNGTTHVEFVHHLTDRKGIGELGPGREYYMDMLVRARDDYYPALGDDYVAQGASAM